MNFLKDIVWSPVDYKNTAVIAREAANELFERLDWMTVKPTVVLDLGCGTGDDSVRLQQRYPDAKVLAVDNAYSMVEHAQLGFPCCVCALAEALPLPNQSVDLIFASMLLPWHVDHKRIFKEWKRVLRPNGLLIFNALGLDTLKECSALFEVEATPQLNDMHDVGDGLLAAGFSDPVLDVNYFTTVYRSQEKLIAELVGSGMLAQASASSLLNQLIPEEDGTYPLTYEVINAHAFAPEKSERQVLSDGEVKVPLSQLRRSL